jgi:hypothetical protein
MSRIDPVLPRGSASGTRTALQIAAILCTLGILFQGATAGQILSRSLGAVGVHGAGAIAFHVLSALMVIAAAMLWRTERGSVWAIAISSAVFVLGLVQAYVGDEGVLSVHAPLALALALGTAWVLAWSFLSGRPTARHGL